MRGDCTLCGAPSGPASLSAAQQLLPNERRTRREETPREPEVPEKSVCLKFADGFGSPSSSSSSLPFFYLPLSPVSPPRLSVSLPAAAAPLLDGMAKWRGRGTL